MARPRQEAWLPLGAIPAVGRERGESGPVGQPTSGCEPQACPALRLGRGEGTGEAPPGTPRQPPTLPSSSPPGAGRHRRYLIPAGEREPPRGQGDSCPHPRCSPSPHPAGAAGSMAAVLGIHLVPSAALRHGSTSGLCREAEAALPSRQGCTANGEQGPERCTQLPGTDRQTDRRRQSTAIPAPPARKNSRRLDPDQVFPQVLFDMNIKGASQIPSAVRGLKNPCRGAPAPPCPRTGPSSPQSHAPLPRASTSPPQEAKPHTRAGRNPAPPASHCHPRWHMGTPPVTPHCPAPAPPARHGRVPWVASGAGRLLATLLQALACCPGGLGKAQGGCVGLEAGVGAGRGFHTAAREGESTASCVTQPHPARPAPPCSPSPSAPAHQETPSAGASSAGSRGSASSPASHPALLTRASFLPSLPRQSFVPRASITAPSKVPAGRPVPGLRHPERSQPAWRGVRHPHKGPSSIPQQHRGSLLFPSYQTLGRATQHPAPQTPSLTLAPLQAAQDQSLTACLAKVPGPPQEPPATRGPG